MHRIHCQQCAPPIGDAHLNRRPDQDRARFKKRRRPNEGGPPRRDDKRLGPNEQVKSPGARDGGRSEAIDTFIKKAPAPLRRYIVCFYESFPQAHADKEKLGQQKAQCDQLNIVIKAEGNMEDPELLSFGKVFAGEAWTLIHKRRVDDGWYNEMHE